MQHLLHLTVLDPCTVAGSFSSYHSCCKKQTLPFLVFHDDIFNIVYQVSSLSQHVAELEGELDRAHRDRSSLTSQLEDTLRQLTSQEQHNTQVHGLHCAR